jgi:uncharacterized protein YbbK (DUF523 family)
VSDNSIPRPTIGISSCLYGKRVRYDGRDKQLPQLIRILQTRANLVPICPEVAIGLGVPRPPIQLTDDLESPVARRIDHPQQVYNLPLRQFAWQVASDHAIDGYLFKARSPSCGLGTTPVYIAGTPQQQKVSGIFAGELLLQLPGIPATDESIIAHPDRLDRFLGRCLEYRRQRLYPGLD